MFLKTIDGRFIRSLSMCLAGFLALIVWRLTYHTSCASLIIVLSIACVVGFFSIEFNIVKRKIIADGFFIKGTVAHSFSSARVFATFWAILSALVSTSFLLFSFLVWSILEQFFLLLFAVITARFVAFSPNWLTSMLKQEVSAIGMKHLLVTIIGTALLLSLIVVALFSPLPIYVIPGGGIDQVISKAREAFGSNCAIIDIGVKLAAQKEALIWYIADQVNKGILSPTYKWVFWITFLVMNGISILAYMRYMVQIANIGANWWEAR